jgi:hypothetical protein
VREDVTMSHFDESEFDPVTMSGEIFESVKGLTEETEGFVDTVVIAGVSLCLDCGEKGFADVTCRGSPAALFIGNIILHSCSRVNFQFALKLATREIDCTGSTGPRSRGSNFLASSPSA